jgi:hypothetical protein
MENPFGDIPDEMLELIYQQAGSFTREQMSRVDKRFQSIHPSYISHEDYEKILFYIKNEEILSGLEICTALNLLAPYRDELNDTIHKYAQQAANLIKGRTPAEIRQAFS